MNLCALKERVRSSRKVANVYLKRFFATISVLTLVNCVKNSEDRIIERIENCNIANCYLVDETGALHVQVFRDCVLEFKLIKDQQSEQPYWQIVLDNESRSVRRVDAHKCEWERN